MGTAVDVRFGSRVDGALARAFFTFAALVGAAMCSACSCGARKAAGHNALRGSGPGQIQDTASAMSALPPKATSNAATGMSAKGHKRTWADYSLISSAICWRRSGDYRSGVRTRHLMVI